MLMETYTLVYYPCSVCNMGDTGIDAVRGSQDFGVLVPVFELLRNDEYRQA